MEGMGYTYGKEEWEALRRPRLTRQSAGWCDGHRTGGGRCNGAGFCPIYEIHSEPESGYEGRESAGRAEGDNGECDSEAVAEPSSIGSGRVRPCPNPNNICDTPGEPVYVLF